MEDFFLSILNMSMRAGAVILFVLLARLLMRKLPRRYSYALWIVVLFRLLCPVSFESRFSLLLINPQPLPQNIGLAATPQINTGISSLDYAVNAVLPAATPQTSANPMQIWLFVGEMVWLLGLAIALMGSLIALCRLYRKLADSISVMEGCQISSRIQTAFVLGLIRPVIYLPAGLSEQEREHVLLHERMHIRKGDVWIKALFYVALCIHWFNPLVWAAFYFMVQDMEAACDESVLRKRPELRTEYAQSLLKLSAPRSFLYGAPIAFGEGSVKKRIKNVLKFKKPAFWITATGAVAAIMLIVFLAANPKETLLETPDAQELKIATTAMQEYNEQQNRALQIPGDRVFTAIDVLHVQRLENKTVYFLWERSGAYAQSEDGLNELSAESRPCRLTLVQGQAGSWELDTAEFPDDGNAYADSLKKLCLAEDGREIEGLAEKLADYPNTNAHTHLQSRFNLLVQQNDVYGTETQPASYTSVEEAAAETMREALTIAFPGASIDISEPVHLSDEEINQHSGIVTLRQSSQQTSSVFSVTGAVNGTGGTTCYALVLPAAQEGRFYCSYLTAENGGIVSCWAPIPGVQQISELGLQLPLEEDAFVSSAYGWKFTKGQLDFHSGIAFSSSDLAGKNVLAAQSGSVLELGKDEVRGNYLIIGDQDGVSTLYAHTASILVKEGETVQAGEAIAIAGSSGDVGVPTLYFEVRYGGIVIDPVLCLENLNNNTDTSALLSCPVIGDPDISREFSDNHPGIDFKQDWQADIVAAAAGTVIFSGNDSQNGYGNYVLIDHGEGLQTLYAHNERNLVQAGDTVQAGDLIALAGSTGNSTGPHLHFEVRLKEQPQNPEDYF